MPEGMKPIDFAPMEGITDFVFRSVYNEMYPGISRFFLPFISPTENYSLGRHHMNELDPAVNAGMNVVPQILTKEPEYFNRAAEEIAGLGYSEVNLNLGCPSGTVTSKFKGSGLLRDPDGLRKLLDGIFENPPIAISIKTRIGYEKPEEWQKLLELYKDYPIASLIVHPRTRVEYYKGGIHTDALAEACRICSFPVICNGNLFTPDDIRTLNDLVPDAQGIMIGRGLIACPSLIRVLNGGSYADVQELEAYHDRLFYSWKERINLPAAMGRIREVMSYMVRCFDDPGKPWKAMRKARREDEYLAAAALLFQSCKLRDVPCFIPFDQD